MARPRKIGLAREKAKELQRRLRGALETLQELKGCLEMLAGLEVEPVYAELVERRKSTRYGEYTYPVLRFCAPGSSPWEGGCEEVHATRFRELAEALVEVDRFARELVELSRTARRVLEGLDAAREALQRLEEFPSLEAGKGLPRSSPAKIPSVSSEKSMMNK